MNRALRASRKANLNEFPYVLEIASLWEKLARYPRHFRDRAYLRNPPPLNPVSIMIANSTGQSLLRQALSPEISDMFTFLVATFTFDSGISSIQRPFPFDHKGGKTNRFPFTVLQNSAFLSILFPTLLFRCRAGICPSRGFGKPNRA